MHEHIVNSSTSQPWVTLRYIQPDTHVHTRTHSHNHSMSWEAQNGTCVWRQRMAAERLCALSSWRWQIWTTFLYKHEFSTYLHKIPKYIYAPSWDLSTRKLGLLSTHAHKCRNHDVMPFCICSYTHTQTWAWAHVHLLHIRRHKTLTASFKALRQVFGCLPFGHPSTVQRASSPSSR